MPVRRFALFFTLLSSPALAQDLQTAEQQLATAFTQKDAAAIERFLAPGFVLRGSPDVPRETWIKNAVTLCWGDTFDISDFTIVNQTDDTAVVSLLLTTYRDPLTCDPATIRSLLTDVWARTDGRWRLALRHSGPAGQGVAGQFARTAPPPPRWERSAELSMVATGGNTETQTIGAGMAVTWRPGVWTTRSRASFVRSVTDDELTAESLVSEIRQSRTLTPRADVFARAEYLVNRFAGIGDRITAEGGFGWLLLQRPAHSIKIDGGAGLTHESRLAGESLTFASATVTSLYKWQLSATTTVNEEATLSTDVAEPANWRVQNGLNLSHNLTRILTVRISHELKHVNRPVPGFRKTDTVVSAALVTKF
jgi:putative salt-induced outer membrane protein YdiY